jgi:hypothetical protein
MSSAADTAALDAAADATAAIDDAVIAATIEPPTSAETQAAEPPANATATHALSADDPSTLVPPPTPRTHAVNSLQLAKTRTDLEEHHSVRLSTLPDHPSLLAPPATVAPAAKHSPEELALALLDQGYAFLTSSAPARLRVRGATALRDRRRGSPGSSTPVEVRRGDVAGEHWVMRSSCHRAGGSGGTASWGEFVHGLFGMGHPAMEKSFTPNVEESVQVCTWDVGDVGAWTKVTLGGSSLFSRDRRNRG